MRQVTFFVLAAVTIPVAAAAVLIPQQQPSAPPPSAAGLLFPGLKDRLNQAAKLAVTGPNGAVVVERKTPASDKPAEGWTLPDKGGYPVPATTVKPILTGLGTLRLTEPKTSRPKLYSRLDLGDPGKGSESHELALDDAKGGNIAKVIIGKRKYDPLGTGNDGVYVRVPDNPQTWLAVPPITIPNDEIDWIDRKIVDIDADRLKEIVLTPAGGKPLAFFRDKAEDKLAIRDLPKDTKLKADNPGSEIASGFRYLDLTDVRPAAQVTAAAVGTAQLVTFDGLTANFTLVKQDDATWVTVTAQGTGDAAKQADEITRRTQGWAFKIPDPRATTLETKLADLVQEPEKPANGNKGAPTPAPNPPPK